MTKKKPFKIFKAFGIIAAGLGVIIDAVITMVEYFFDKEDEKLQEA